MKILIITMTCGEGHNHFSFALNNALQKRGEISEVYDIYAPFPRLKKLNNNSYLFACRYIPKLYEQVWLMELARDPEKRYNKYSGLQPSIRKAIKPLRQKISEFCPDAVICTHDYVSAAMDQLIREGFYTKPVYALLTDFTVHPYWESSIAIDYVITPSKHSWKLLTEKGFREDQLLDLGLPVNDKFCGVTDKKAEKEKIGLDPNKLTVVLTSGGYGLYPYQKLLDCFKQCDDVQWIAACGKNEKQKRDLERYQSKRNLDLKVLGYCDLSPYFRAADVAFAKGGCSTMNELLHAKVVPILLDKLIIQENQLKQLLVEAGAGLGMQKVKQAPKLLEKVKDPALREAMQTAALPFYKKDATQSIVERICGEAPTLASPAQEA